MTSYALALVIQCGFNEYICVVTESSGIQRDGPKILVMQTISRKTIKRPDRLVIRLPPLIPIRHCKVIIDTLDYRIWYSAHSNRFRHLSSDTGIVYDGMSWGRGTLVFV